MSMNPGARRPVGRQVATPPRGAKAPKLAPDLPLPNERDESTHMADAAPDAQMVQAQRDIDAGLGDTDMHATPGLDAQRRARLVPDPGGQAPPSGA